MPDLPLKNKPSFITVTSILLENLFKNSGILRIFPMQTSRRKFHLTKVQNILGKLVRYQGFQSEVVKLFAARPSFKFYVWVSVLSTGHNFQGITIKRDI